MTIGFFHVEGANRQASAMGYDCARAMIASARRVMPYVPIVHFTDQASPGVKGVNEVRRKPSEPMGLLRMRHCAGVEGEWLFVDTDIIFQRKVKSVFKLPFDVAVTSRDWGHVKPAAGFTDRMPFNTGVVFSRSPRFWAEVYTRLRALDPEQQVWMGEQQVICDVAAEDRYRVRHLSGAIYNFPPVKADAPTPEQLEADAAILHYKGDRKALMLARAREVRRCA